MKADGVRILMATFDGQPFLRQQLDSIGRQTFEGWSLVANDDGSRDNSVAILEEYRARWPDHMHIVDGASVWGSAKKNFGFLIDVHGDADYIFLADQDDIWNRVKIQVLLAEVQRLEAIHGPDTPVLVHSDLSLIGVDGALLHASMDEAQTLQSSTRRHLRHILVQNNVTGCSAVLNRALRDAAVPIPDEAIMHDWWLALVAASFGVIGYLPAQYVGYRQHGANSVGAKPYSWETVMLQMGRLHENRESLRNTFAQASAFLARYGSQLDMNQRAIVQAYAQLPKSTRIDRRRIIFQHGFWKAGISRNLGLLLLI